MEMELPVEPQSLKKLTFTSTKRALDLFSPVHAHLPPPDVERLNSIESSITIFCFRLCAYIGRSKKIRVSHKRHLLLKLSVGYGGIKSSTAQPHSHAKSDAHNNVLQASTSNALTLPGPGNSGDPQKAGPQNDLAVGPPVLPKGINDGAGTSIAVAPSHGISERVLGTDPKATLQNVHQALSKAFCRCLVGTFRLQHLWKESQAGGRDLCGMRHGKITGGHLGWVRSIAFDPSNSWFCTGSADRTIKIWDLGTGKLKLTLTGHIEQIRGLAVSNRHTYMFSAGDDKQVKCWDLEQNKVIRSYHGHLSGVYCLALHPTIDVLLTGGRDSVCRVWDIRSKMQVFALSGHNETVCSVFTRPTDPQVITGSHDTTIKFWDLRYGKTMCTLTHHKKSVRAMALHPNEDCFASASADNIKKFNLPKGEFLHNM
ncbi:hypothetical protein RJ640_022769, partial [Escallonia rubra]